MCGSLQWTPASRLRWYDSFYLLWQSKGEVMPLDQEAYFLRKFSTTVLPLIAWVISLIRRIA